MIYWYHLNRLGSINIIWWLKFTVWILNYCRYSSITPSEYNARVKILPPNRVKSVRFEYNTRLYSSIYGIQYYESYSIIQLFNSHQFYKISIRFIYIICYILWLSIARIVSKEVRIRQPLYRNLLARVLRSGGLTRVIWRRGDRWRMGGVWPPVPTAIKTSHQNNSKKLEKL